jgi:phosphoadenosine phosphosulfate reductase
MKPAQSITPEQLYAELAGLKTAERFQVLYEIYGPRLVATTSFGLQAAVSLHLIHTHAPQIPVVFIDTGYHFPETLETVEAVRRHYGLNLRIMTVAPHDEALWQADPENCCSAVKVGQLDRALAGKAAWMSGLRRDEAPTRANAPILARDLRGLVKVNPLANWTAGQVDAYIAEHDIIVNPLVAQGYPSIGCMPCTKVTAVNNNAMSPATSGSRLESRPAGRRR